MLSPMPQLFHDSGKGLEAKYAPMGGPMQKQIANAMPICARALERVVGVVTSDMMALYFCGGM